jgi:hypothetical protein
VPRISDEFLDCVIYLYPSGKDADDGSHIGGSGFLVAVPLAENPTNEWPDNVWHVYAVTNKHVVESGHTVIRMNTKDGRKDVLPTEERAWVSSPGHDVAACLISFDAQAFKFKFIKQEYFITSGIVDRLHIGPGDDVFVVGRFINHEGKQRNIPTARFGNIAQMPFEPVQIDQRTQQESFFG